MSILPAERCFVELFCCYSVYADEKKFNKFMFVWKAEEKRVCSPQTEDLTFFFLNAKCCHHSNRQQLRCAKIVCVRWWRSIIAVHKIIYFVELLSFCQERTLTHPVKRNQWCFKLTGYISSLTFCLSDTHDSVLLHQIHAIACVRGWIFSVLICSLGQDRIDTENKRLRLLDPIQSNLIFMIWPL